MEEERSDEISGDAGEQKKEGGVTMC